MKKFFLGLSFLMCLPARLMTMQCVSSCISTIPTCCVLGLEAARCSNRWKILHGEECILKHEENKKIYHQINRISPYNQDPIQEYQGIISGKNINFEKMPRRMKEYGCVSFATTCCAIGLLCGSCTGLSFGCSALGCMNDIYYGTHVYDEILLKGVCISCTK